MASVVGSRSRIPLPCFISNAGGEASVVGGCSHIPLPSFRSDAAKLLASWGPQSLEDPRGKSDTGRSQFDAELEEEEEEELRWMLAQHGMEVAQLSTTVPEEEWDAVARMPSTCSSTSSIGLADGPCPICMEEGVPLAEVGQCGHAFCKECLKHYITLKIRERTAPIRCCALKCPEHLGCALVRQVVGGALASQHELHLAEAAMTNKVYCPFPNCGAAYDLEKCVAEVRCLECSRSFCGWCRVPWHEGLSCTEFNELPEQLRTPEDAAFMRMARESRWRECPACRNVISKHEDDCNWIRCRCGCAFCFRCGEKYLDDTPQADNVHGRAGCQCPLFDDAEEGVAARRQLLLVPPEVRLQVMGLVPLPTAQLRRHQYVDLEFYSQVVAAGYCQCPKWLTQRMEHKECPYCARTFSTLESLSQHLANTKQHPVYACCGRVFLDSNSLLQHAQQRHRRW